MTSLAFEAQNMADTTRLGRQLAELLPPGTTVALVGTLGAGKTRLVRAIAEALEIDGRDVTSPTFVLCQQYRGRQILFHLDAYRLADDDEFLALGPEDFFESEAITLIEWADRVTSCLPSEHLRIEVEVTGHDSRRFSISATGTHYHELVESLKLRLET